MLDKSAVIEERYDEINRALMEVGNDYQRAAELGIERASLEPLIEKARRYRQILQQLEEAGNPTNRGDEEFDLLAHREIEEIQPEAAKLELEIIALLVPKDPRDHRNVIVEIRAGTGGDEAALFAADLFRMYRRDAEPQGWESESCAETGSGTAG